MKELALLQIDKIDLKIRTIPEVERTEKIDLLYSLGYVWDPYKKQFINWSIDKVLKPKIIYKSATNIIEIHTQLTHEFINKNGQIKTFEEVEKIIYDKDKITNLELYFELLSGIFGFALSLISILVFILTTNYSVTLSMTMCSMLLVYYWVSQKQIHSKIEFEFGEAPIWIKYKNIFVLFKYLLMGFTYYLIFKLTDSYWMPAIVIAIAIIILRALIQKRLSRKYWQYSGINYIRDLYE